ncbi:sensor histidine kinase, partial [Nocardioides jensenii]|uniref:sensor histidine kinase n=1 Tax=Nocardioides jensenii TaxID=1843 RepID=UPI00082D4642
LPPPHGAWWREGAVIAIAFALCLLGGVVQVDDTLSAPPGAAYVIGVLSCAVLPWRHRSPVTALAVTTVCGMLVAPAGLLLTPLIVAPAAIAAYAVAVHTERRLAGMILPASAVLLILPTPLFGDVSWADASRLGASVAVVLVAGVLGHSTQNRRAYLAAMEERAHRAELGRESEARRRVTEERMHIARELHDLVAHQITLANAQATVAAHLFDTRPEQTRTSLDQLVETTSNALDDLRATVGLLRESGESAAPAEPAPGLSRLPTLVESFRRVGLEVSVHEEGRGRALPPGVDLTAYRIIQEALTNVTKHAGAGVARVNLVWGVDRVSITVADDGAESGPNPPGPGVAPRPPGYGLIGMRERATAIGGDLSAGRRSEGGFLVATDLPAPPARDGLRKGGEENLEAGTMGDEATGDRESGGTT